MTTLLDRAARRSMTEPEPNPSTPGLRLATAVLDGQPVAIVLGSDRTLREAAVDDMALALAPHPVRLLRVHGVDGVDLTLPRLVEELGGGDRPSAEDDELIVRLLTQDADETTHVVLVIEHAEQLTRRTLAFLQVASTVFGVRSPRLQLVFAGEPRFEALLDDPEFSALRDGPGYVIDLDEVHALPPPASAGLLLPGLAVVAMLAVGGLAWWLLSGGSEAPVASTPPFVTAPLTADASRSAPVPGGPGRSQAPASPGPAPEPPQARATAPAPASQPPAPSSPPSDQPPARVAGPAPTTPSRDTPAPAPAPEQPLAPTAEPPRAAAQADPDPDPAPGTASIPVPPVPPIPLPPVPPTADATPAAGDEPNALPGPTRAEFDRFLDRQNTGRVYSEPQRQRLFAEYMEWRHTRGAETVGVPGNGELATVTVGIRYPAHAPDSATLARSMAHELATATAGTRVRSTTRSPSRYEIRYVDPQDEKLAQQIARLAPPPGATWTVRRVDTPGGSRPRIELWLPAR